MKWKLKYTVFGRKGINFSIKEKENLTDIRRVKLSSYIILTSQFKKGEVLSKWIRKKRISYQKHRL
ncbi:MAG: hypothetical protein RR588_17170, partial [Solibacillus sp.]